MSSNESMAPVHGGAKVVLQTLEVAGVPLHLLGPEGMTVTSVQALQLRAQAAVIVASVPKALRPRTRLELDAVEEEFVIRIKVGRDK